MAFMELSSELTRSDKAAQCLETTKPKRGNEDEMEEVMILKKTPLQIDTKLKCFTTKLWEQLPSHLEYPD